MKITRYMFARFVADSLLTLPTASSNGICQHNKMFVMKKIFISIFAVAAMLNLCSCNKELVDKPDLGKAIVFDNIQTRAVVNSVNSANDILRMGVFAQMNLGDEDKQEPGSNDFIMLLENEHVKRDNLDTDWTYDHTCYWVADRIFHFFAVWPYSGENSSVTNVSSIEGTGNGEYGYSVTFETPETADQDLLTAKTTYNTKTGTTFPESVDFIFKHELTNVNLKVWSNGAPENVNDKIKVKKVTISNVTKQGTLNTTISGSSWSLSSTKMSFTKEYDGVGETVSQAQIIDGKLTHNDPNNVSPGIPFGEDGLLLIPQTITNSGPILVTVVYYLYNDEGKLWEKKRLMTLLPEGTWPAGKKLTYNLIISGDRTITEFQINTVVEDWIPHSEEIDFTEQVEVRENEWIQWDETTCESVDDVNGKVVLFTDVDKVATCKFNIRTPIGATWTASLIPLTASAMDAFSIVEGSKYGDVGTDNWQYVKIKINNPDPISARNECLLRITVQTPNGRTIVVKNLMPPATNDKIKEYTIIQNLING